MKTHLLSNQKREILFRYLLDHPQDPLKVRSLAAKLHYSPSFVSVSLNSLKREGYLNKDGLNADSPEIRAWKILFNIRSLTPHLKGFASHIDAKGIGLYGSCANGTNTQESDVDLWVKVDSRPSDLELAKAKSILRKAIGRDVSIFVIEKERIISLQKSDPSLYFSLLHSFHLWGERFV